MIRHRRYYSCAMYNISEPPSRNFIREYFCPPSHDKNLRNFTIAKILYNTDYSMCMQYNSTAEAQYRGLHNGCSHVVNVNMRTTIMQSSICTWAVQSHSPCNCTPCMMSLYLVHSDWWMWLMHLYSVCHKGFVVCCIRSHKKLQLYYYLLRFPAVLYIIIVNYWHVVYIFITSDTYISNIWH